MSQGYTSEEHASAWATYYAQQGYEAAQIASMIPGYDTATINSWISASSSGAGAGGYGGYGAAAGSSGRPGASSSGAGYGSGSGYGGGANGSGSGAGPALLDADFIQQSSAYVPGAEGKAPSSGKAKAPPPGRRETVIRKAGGRMWEDLTLLEWDPKWYRLFVGDVSNDVSERTLDEAFNKYPSYCKCKVVRDRLSQKAKYAFIAFKDPEDYLRAWKEMDGKYVGNRPIRLSKVRDDKYGGTKATQVSARKAKDLDKLRKNKGNPGNRPTLW